MQLKATLYTYKRNNSQINNSEVRGLISELSTLQKSFFDTHAKV